MTVFKKFKSKVNAHLYYYELVPFSQRSKISINYRKLPSPCQSSGRVYFYTGFKENRVHNSSPFQLWTYYVTVSWSPGCRTWAASRCRWRRTPRSAATRRRTPAAPTLCGSDAAPPSASPEASEAAKRHGHVKSVFLLVVTVKNKSSHDHPFL